MSAEEQLQTMVDQTIEMALMNVNAYYKEIETYLNKIYCLRLYTIIHLITW